MTTRVLSPDRVNGHIRSAGGVYIPSPESVRKVLDKCRIPSEPKINYVPQNQEIADLDIYRATKKAVLLVGPTGVGKSMLVRAVAQRWEVPFMWMTCHPDKTEGQMLGRPDIVFASEEVEKEVKTIQMQQFRPSAIAYAGLADQPIVLFLDELHKLRRDMDALLYPLINEREINLGDHLGPGEIYKLHPETIVVLALNPYYEGGGIERVSPAIRQRVATIEFEMITEASKLMDIVRANVPSLGSHEQVIQSICDMCASLAKVYLEFKKRAVVNITDANTVRIKTDLRSSMRNINEAPSPRVVVATAEAIIAGQKPARALQQCVFNAITNDLGSTGVALRTIAQDVFGIM